MQRYLWCMWVCMLCHHWLLWESVKCFEMFCTRVRFLLQLWNYNRLLMSSISQYTNYSPWSIEIFNNMIVFVEDNIPLQIGVRLPGVFAANEISTFKRSYEKDTHGHDCFTKAWFPYSISNIAVAVQHYRMIQRKNPTSWNLAIALRCYKKIFDGLRSCCSKCFNIAGLIEWRLVMLYGNRTKVLTSGHTAPPHQVHGSIASLKIWSHYLFTNEVDCTSTSAIRLYWTTYLLWL